MKCFALCAIWYHLCNLKNVKNTYGGMLLLVKLKAFHMCFNILVLEHVYWLQIMFFSSLFN